MLWRNKFWNYIHLHWQFFVTNSGFWLVNIPLWKFGTSSKQKMKMIKTQIFDEKQANKKIPEKNIQT